MFICTFSVSHGPSCLSQVPPAALGQDGGLLLANDCVLRGGGGWPAWPLLLQPPFPVWRGPQPEAGSGSMSSSPCGPSPQQLPCPQQARFPSLRCPVALLLPVLPRRLSHQVTGRGDHRSVVGSGSCAGVGTWGRQWCLRLGYRPGRGDSPGGSCQWWGLWGGAPGQGGQEKRQATSEGKQFIL